MYPATWKTWSCEEADSSPAISLKNLPSGLRRSSTNNTVQRHILCEDSSVTSGCLPNSNASASSRDSIKPLCGFHDLTVMENECQGGSIFGRLSNRLKTKKSTYRFSRSAPHAIPSSTSRRESFANEFRDNCYDCGAVHRPRDVVDQSAETKVTYSCPQRLVSQAIIYPQITVIPQRRILKPTDDCSLWAAIVVTGVLARSGHEEVYISSGDDGIHRFFCFYHTKLMFTQLKCLVIYTTSILR